MSRATITTRYFAGQLLSRFRQAARDFRTASLDLLFPPRCTICGDDLYQDEVGCNTNERAHLCEACRLEILDEDIVRCKRCGARVPNFTSTEAGCIACHSQNYQFTQTAALGCYSGALRKTVLWMKRANAYALTKSIAQLHQEVHGERLRAFNADLIVPVPMHWARRIVRGTNSADTLAEQLATDLALPVVNDLLRRHRNTSPQSKLPRGKRAKNMQGAFALSKRQDISGARMLLVDDILTTGATCNEVARTLRSAGAAEVMVAVVARTDHP